MSDAAPRELTADEKDNITMYVLAQDVPGAQAYVYELFVKDWLERHGEETPT